MRAARSVLLAALGTSAFAATLYFSVVASKHGDHAAAGNPDAATQSVPRSAPHSREQLLGPQELADRAWAIDTLGAVSSDASVQALAHVLASSGDYRERLEAVIALQRIASTGAVAAAARQALARATTDRDEQVAARARAALGGD